MTTEEAEAHAKEALDLLLKIGSKMMEENEKYIQENKIPDGPLVGKLKNRGNHNESL
ncbi:molybdenum ABC transporter, periplasmic molybdenum-binding [Escherichia phage vB_EcoM_ESCO10]|nr:molybdenum ABC transporter, periplasmic molybdenum-binding [Escherichia phage vB_EcoM_ESCO10]